MIWRRTSTSSRNFRRVSHESRTDPSARSCAQKEKLRYARRGALVSLAVLLLLPAGLLALGIQGSRVEREPAPARRGAGQQPRQPKRPGQGGFFQRLREMPPQQQQRVMENSPQFQRLPPERQEMIRERLQAWNDMSPQQQERVRQREEIFQALSPAQRQEARLVFPQYRNLTPPRRQAVLVAFRHLRDLPPNQRQGYLQSQEVREQFSPHERDILTGLNRLLPGSRPYPPDNSEP